MQSICNVLADGNIYFFIDGTFIKCTNRYKDNIENLRTQLKFRADAIFYSTGEVLKIRNECDKHLIASFIKSGCNALFTVGTPEETLLLANDRSGVLLTVMKHVKQGIIDEANLA